MSKGEGQGGRNSSDRERQLARREKDRNEIEKCMCFSEYEKHYPHETCHDNIYQHYAVEIPLKSTWEQYFDQEPAYNSFGMHNYI